MVSTLVANIGAARANGTISASTNIIHGTHSQLIAFLILNIWPSHFGIPLLLAIIFFSKRVKRDPTFVNLCVTFLIVGISSSLLLYAGRITGSEPSKMLCLLQASVLYGFPPMTSVAAFTLILQTFFTIRTSFYKHSSLAEQSVIRVWLLLTGPYLAFFTSVLVTAKIGASDPVHVTRNRRFFYCSLECLPLTNTITSFAAIFLTATLGIAIWILLIIYKHRVAVPKEERQMYSYVDLSMVARILAFSLYLIVALSLSLLSIKAPESPAPDLIISTASSALLLIFGTHKDVVSVLCFWRKRRVGVEVLGGSHGMRKGSSIGLESYRV